MKLMNDFDDIYSHDGFDQDSDESYVCPVCKKKYKKVETMHKHYYKKSCHSMVDVFSDTVTERYMLDVFTALSFRENEKNLVSLSIFRRSKYYGQVAEFFIFCRKNNIKSWEHYIQYCVEYYNGHMTGLLSYSIKESTLMNYYVWSRNNINVEESKRFIEENLEKLRGDFNFLARSLEKGNIALEDAISSLGASYFVNLSAAEKKMVCDLYG